MTAYTISQLFAATGGAPGTIDIGDLSGVSPLGVNLVAKTTAADMRVVLALGNVNNTSDADKPISTATAASIAALQSSTTTSLATQQAAIDLKAPIASPALTGVPTAPTAASGTNTQQLATTAYVRGEVTTGLAALVGSAPGTLDTLQELAAQLQADEGVAAALATTVAGKASRSANLSDLADLAAARVNLGLTVRPAGGTADDTTALQAAITAAGVGGTIELIPNVTYTISASLVLLDNQRLVGNGAIIKRANQVISTLAVAMTANVTATATVVDAANFRVGAQVSFAQVSVPRASLALGSTLSDIRTIIGKSGNVLTLSGPATCNLSIGATIFSTFACITHANRTIVEDVIFDGNRANFSFARWEVTTEVWEPTGTADPRTWACKFNNAPGEVIVMQASRGKIAFCTATNVGGNGTHFSGCTGTKVLYNYFATGNLDTAVGHVSGGIGFSMGVTDVLIEGNTVDAFARGCGDISDTDDGAVIVRNIFKNCYGHGVLISASAKRVKVEDNEITNCATDTSKVYSADSYGGVFLNGGYGSDISVMNNAIGGPLYIVATTGTYGGVTSTNSGIVLDGNKVTGETLISGVVGGTIKRLVATGKMRIASLTDVEITDCFVDLTGSGYYCLQAYSGTFTRTKIRNFRAIGGGRSISVEAGVTLAGLTIEGGTLYNASARGIEVDTTSPGFVATGVEIRRGAADVTHGFIGILNKCPGSSITGCKIWNDGSGVGEEGLYPGATATGSWWQGNEVHGSWSSAMYFGDVTTAFAEGNAYHGSFNQGTGNTVNNNRSI